MHKNTERLTALDRAPRLKLGKVALSVGLKSNGWRRAVVTGK